MSRLDDQLAHLEASWLSLPDDVRARAADAWAGSCMLLGEGLQIIGPQRMAVLQAPMIAVFMTAMQQVLLWRTPADEVFARVEGKFPALVNYLKAVTAALGLDAPAPPPGSPFPVAPPDEP